MAEAVGLGIGAIGLASLFSTCLECFDYVDSARSYERDSEILIGKVLMQRVRLSIWGDLVGLNGVNEYTNEILESFKQNPAQEAGVRTCLIQLEKLLISVQKLVNEHSLVIDEENIPPVQALIARESRIGRLKKALGIDRAMKTNDITTVPLKIITAPLKKRIVWAIRDKTRMTSLVEDMKDFVDGLNQMVPVLQPRQNRLVQRKIASVVDVEALELVCDLTVDDYPEWSDTASAVLNRDRFSIESQQIEEWIGRTTHDDFDDGSESTLRIGMLGGQYALFPNSAAANDDFERLMNRLEDTTSEESRARCRTMLALMSLTVTDEPRKSPLHPLPASGPSEDTQAQARTRGDFSQALATHLDKVELKFGQDVENERSAKKDVQTELDDLLIVFADLETKRLGDKKRLKDLGQEVSEDEDEGKDEDNDHDHAVSDGEIVPHLSDRFPDRNPSVRLLE